MSYKLMDRCWRFSTAKGGELLVLLSIADFANHGGVAYPSIATLAMKARLTPRNTQRAIRRLVTRGELQLEDGKGPSRVHFYRIILPESVTAEGCQNVRVTNCQDDIRDTRGVTKQPPNPLKRTVIKKERERVDDKMSPSFEKFWGAYPRKEGKAACWKWWTRRKPDEVLRERMLAKIEQAKQTPQWAEPGGKFIPMPLTWLNQERWDDEYALATKQKESHHHGKDWRDARIADKVFKEFESPLPARA